MTNLTTKQTDKTVSVCKCSKQYSVSLNDWKCEDCGKPMTTKVEPTVDKWEMSCKPNGATYMITDSVFNAIGWEKHYTVKERQALNDVVDEIIGKSIAHSVQEAKAEERKEILDGIDRWIGHGSYPLHDCEEGKCHTRTRELLTSLRKEGGI